jgi:hypothetical protein
MYRPLTVRAENADQPVPPTEYRSFWFFANKNVRTHPHGRMMDFVSAPARTLLNTKQYPKQQPRFDLGLHAEQHVIQCLHSLFAAFSKLMIPFMPPIKVQFIWSHIHLRLYYTPRHVYYK